MKKGARIAAAMLSVSVLCSGSVRAQLVGAYPSKPVKIVVTLAPGGANDFIARLFAEKLSQQLKQPFLVESRAGGSGIPGVDYVAKSPPDGYTLLLANTTILAIQPSLFPKLPYDPQVDLVPVSTLAISPSVLVVHPSLPVHGVKELIALAKSQPAKLNYDSPGNGTPFHLSTELFKARTGVDLIHVPYKGSVPAFNDLFAGRVQLMFNNLGDVLPHIKAGKLRPLATTGAKRAPLLPDVPTLSEAGIKNAESVSFFPIVVPRGTPREVIATLHAGIVNAEAQADVQKRLFDLGWEPVGNSPEETTAHIRTEAAKWAKVIKDSGAKVDD